MSNPFGPGQIVQESPMWARWMFRITFLLTTAATAWIAATNLISQETKYELTLVLKLLIDPVVFGISKMFGIKVEDDER